MRALSAVINRVKKKYLETGLNGKKLKNALIMESIYEFFGHDVNGNAICSIELPGDANLLDGTDLIKREIVTALGPGYAELLVVDREGMSGGPLEKMAHRIVLRYTTSKRVINTR